MKGSFEEAWKGVCGGVDTKALGQRFRSGGEAALRAIDGPASPKPPSRFSTVHRVKGDEFDAVVIFWPKPGGKHRVACPTTEWWSTEAGSEEREVAFVAVTRARKTLVLCVRQDSFTELARQRPDSSSCSG